MTFRGVFTALATPFEADGGIDEAALRSLVERQIEGGVSGLVPMGTTGESPTLSHNEHVRVIEIVVDQTSGRCPIIAGSGSNSTDEAMEMTQQAMEIGADASLQVAPYYNKPSQEGFYRHFSTIADAADIPLIIYNIPSRTGKNIENDTMCRLAQHPNIVGVKEASGDLDQVMDLVSRKPEEFVVLSGDDKLAYPIVALGGHGVISVAGNYLPAKMSEFMAVALEGDLITAMKMHYALLPLFKGLFVDTNPIPLKYAMSRKGWLKEVYRLPMCSMSDALKQQLDSVLDALPSDWN
jgi:4-hydroxy-tetrahydrodipicolinate synthase